MMEDGKGNMEKVRWKMDDGAATFQPFNLPTFELFNI